MIERIEVKVLKATLALIIWTVIISVASLMPLNDASPELFPQQDKLMHFIFYSVLSFLLSGVFKQYKQSNNSTLMWSIALSSAYGILIEYLQSALNTGRHFDYFDIIANIIGSLTGSLLYHLLRKK